MHSNGQSLAAGGLRLWNPKLSERWNAFCWHACSLWMFMAFYCQQNLEHSGTLWETDELGRCHLFKVDRPLQLFEQSLPINALMQTQKHTNTHKHTLALVLSGRIMGFSWVFIVCSSVASQQWRGECLECWCFKATTSKLPLFSLGSRHVELWR